MGLVCKYCGFKPQNGTEARLHLPCAAKPALATKKSIKLELGDKSQFIIWYNENGVIVELYHELPMEGTPPVASALTCLNFMLPAIYAAKGDPYSPLLGLYRALDGAVFNAGW